VTRWHVPLMTRWLLRLRHMIRGEDDRRFGRHCLRSFHCVAPDWVFSSKKKRRRRRKKNRRRSSALDFLTPARFYSERRRRSEPQALRLSPRDSPMMSYRRAETQSLCQMDDKWARWHSLIFLSLFILTCSPSLSLSLSSSSSHPAASRPRVSTKTVRCRWKFTPCLVVLTSVRQPEIEVIIHQFVMELEVRLKIWGQSW